MDDNVQRLSELSFPPDFVWGAATARSQTSWWTIRSPVWAVWFPLWSPRGWATDVSCWGTSSALI